MHHHRAEHEGAQSEPGESDFDSQVYFFFKKTAKLACLTPAAFLAWVNSFETEKAAEARWRRGRWGGHGDETLLFTGFFWKQISLW